MGLRRLGRIPVDALMVLGCLPDSPLLTRSPPLPGASLNYPPTTLHVCLSLPLVSPLPAVLRSAAGGGPAACSLHRDTLRSVSHPDSPTLHCAAMTKCSRLPECLHAL